MNIGNRILITLVIFLAISCDTKDKEDITTISYIESDIYVQHFQAEVADLVSLKICDTAPLNEITAMYFTGFSSKQAIYFKTEEDNCLTLEIDPLKTKVAGAYTIDALLGDKLLTIATVELDSKKAVGKIESFVGPKSVNFGATSGSMITVFPVDQYHNATGKNEDVKYVFSTGDKVDSIKVKSKGTYSSTKIPDKKVSKLLMGATIDKGNTIEQSVRYLSGCPEEIIIDLNEVFPVADGRQFFKASTRIMKDAGGEIIKDGTLVYFILYDESGQEVSKFRSVAINGIAATWIKNPIYEGYYNLKVHVCSKYSKALNLYFADLVKEFNYYWKEGGKTIEIGPVISSLDQYLPDGTSVRCTFMDNDQTQTIEAIIYSGHATVNLDKLWMDKIPKQAKVSIHGRVYKINSSKNN